MAMEAVVGEFTRMLVSNLAQITKEEFNLMRHFKKDYEELRDRVKESEQFLAYAEIRNVNDQSIKNWLKKLEDVADDANYVLDEIKYEHHRRNMMSQMQPRRHLPWYKHLAFQSKMAHEIKRINATLKKIDDNATRNGYKTEVKQAALAPLLLKETDSITMDPIVVGRENDISEIVKKIVAPTNDVLSVIPICGMAGLGKTTLARRVLNHENTEKHFHERIWICVSDNFNALTLFKRMLKSGTLLEHSTRQDFVEKLREKMNGKRYLLVLDDLWNENKQDWDDFQNSLQGANPNKGNMILVTTRSEGVAAMVNPFMDPHSLSILTEDECWSIIKARAFQNEQVPEQFGMIGKKIAAKCRGLPLVANMIGGTLQGKGEDEWISIQHTLLSNSEIDQNSVLQILKVSYDRLPSPSLKKYFSYCSTFIKDNFINRESVIQRWMGEGFLSTNLGSDMETIGNTYFKILLQNSFFQEAEKDKYGNVTRCKVHDLVHDLACFVSNSESFIVHPGNPIDDIPKVRYLGLILPPKSIQEILTRKKANYLHTLILEDTNVLGLGKILPHLKKLHILLLINTSLEDCPTSIGKLIHLRLLDMSKNKIRNLPSTVCNLYNLQTLRITDCMICELPEDLQHLTDLRHLKFDSWRHDLKMPPNMSRLSSLQTLPVFNVSDKKGCGIDELGYLKNLGGELTIHGLELVKSKAEAECANLVRKPKICNLVFVWGETRSNFVTKKNDEHVLKGLQPHPNIKSIAINGFNGKKFPSWTMKMAIEEDHRLRVLNNLIEVKLFHCNECEEIPTFGHLPHLKHLVLESLGSVRVIGPSFYGYNNDSNSACSIGGHQMKVFFPALKSLELRKLPKLIEWMEVQVTETERCGAQIFPCLEDLAVEDCPMLTTSPSQFPCLKKLSISGVDAELQLKNVRGNLTCLIELSIKGMQNPTCLLDELLCDNHNIKKLEILDCPNLDTPEHLQGWGASLEMMYISNCKKLRKLPVDDLRSLESLKKLIIHKCQNLQTFNVSHGMTSLEYLRISHCDDVEFWVDFSEMKSLTFLSMWNCGKLKSFRKGIEELYRLRQCWVGPLADLADLNDSLIGIGSLQSLETLGLYGNPLWDYLPDQLQNLTSLKRLSLMGFGVEALPEWLGQLSSLEWLWIGSFEKLEQFPSKQVMQRLTKLLTLFVNDCPLWKDRLLRHDSEWSKISRLPKIYIGRTKYDEDTIKKLHNCAPKVGCINLQFG